MGHGLRRRCREGVLAGRILLNYVVWGNGSVSARLWNAIRSDDWAIPHVGLSSLGGSVALTEAMPAKSGLIDYSAYQ
ncbi:hypothetical protein [Escherichia coli]|uniref:hypothetical protein n=1 Tax=Escherichia coli TaxID=562 RepID=UPI001FF5A45B|nr:hypothetical protein [Escherichia coli]